MTLFFYIAFFIAPFYKMMLGKPITLEDMEAVVSFNILTILFGEIFVDAFDEGNDKYILLLGY